jgi:predicted DNA-binding transcriptional regulator AlpA
METTRSQNQSETLLTADEVAQMLRVSPSWIREKCRERALVRDADPFPHVRLGKYVRFRWTEVSHWLDRQSACLTSDKGKT